MSWYAVRVTYGRELKFRQQLMEAGFEAFVPMCRKKAVKNGVSSVVVVPAVSNLCFVNSEKSLIEDFMLSLGEACPARFMWDKARSAPMVVPDKAMSDFIRICMVMSDEVLYLQDITAKLREGRKVRVVDGPFAGVEGVVVRVKRSRRVMVELPGMFAVATTYVHPKDLELL
ncbi:MAG: UpxY family transcription antiterminator [Bacteroidales bacterium]|nr:UpxY family transcription antiterminator [Bacteroidales bacterium]